MLWLIPGERLGTTSGLPRGYRGLPRASLGTTEGLARAYLGTVQGTTQGGLALGDHTGGIPRDFPMGCELIRWKELAGLLTT